MFGYEIPKTFDEITKTLCVDADSKDKTYTQYFLCLQGRIIDEEKETDPNLTDYDIKQQLFKTVVKVSCGN